jgi:2,4-diketo-3-deoxy-L-fuconate hydrolase
MRVAAFALDGRQSWGVVAYGEIRDACSLPDAPANILQLLVRGNHESYLRRVSEDARPVSPNRVRFTTPVSAPPSDPIALGLNYRKHLVEAAQATKQESRPKRPILFSKAASSIVGPDDVIRVDPAVTGQVDWEVELVIVISKEGRDIPAAHAIDHVFGYTIANDVSARDLQFADAGQWYRGKSLDTFCPIGPWIVTRDELGDASGLAISLKVNGVEKQLGSTSEMIFSIPEILESCSQGRTLRPGDLILTGTPDGVGFTRTPPEFLADGDFVTAEIERIGRLENRVLVGRFP